ncbi:MAG: metal-dependent hydrolase [Kiritimatiellae bacterium]|jgi:membrane-bound metal-dependent hydrolase YbcI (DUF457 family)|nr:metal-dependent hydrolase [Kiritimatiellia bacterium]
MSPVGHSIIGLSLAVVALKPATHWRMFLLGAFVFGVLANFPDLPILYWGHDRYEISHSFFVNSALITLVWICWRFLKKFRSSVLFRSLLLASIAWLSHLVLDSFYNHGQGIAIGWPFFDFRLNFPIPIFQTLDLRFPIWHYRNLSVMAIELAAYLPILLVAVGFRMLRLRRNKLGTSHPPNKQNKI